MNNTFLVWLAAMAALGVGLLLLLTPATAEAVADESVTEGPSFASATDSVGSETVTVVETASSSYAYPAATSGSPCTGCAVVVRPTPSYAAPVTPVLVGGCSPAYVPCSTPCSSPCAAYSPCAPSCTPCSSCASACDPCRSCTSCASLRCGTVRPQINRNGVACLAECTFMQLRTNLAQPVCGTVRFRWSATKGSFLDPTASEPIYYAPPTYFACGEDVWVTLVLTCADGVQYTDQMCIHVADNGL